LLLALSQEAERQEKPHALSLTDHVSGLANYSAKALEVGG